jgi:hypothetical protein
MKYTSGRQLKHVLMTAQQVVLIIMKVDKSLKEVWDWKDRIYKETKTLSIEDRVTKSLTTLNQKPSSIIDLIIPYYHLN